MAVSPTWIGIDVSKAELVLARAGQRTPWTEPNTAAGHAAIVRRISAGGAPHVVLEATGQWHRDLCDALANAGIPYTQVDGYKLRSVARSQGQRWKTDAADAQLLVTYGVTLAPAATPPRPAVLRRLATLVARRDDLIGDRTREKNRRKSTTDAVVIASAARIERLLTMEIRTMDQLIAETIAADPACAARYALLTSVPGWGFVTAATLIALLPELGTLSRKQLNALVGIAPYPQDSGVYKGLRRIAGGRALVRKALYVAVHCGATLCKNPVIRTSVPTLQARGKPYKVAIVATMNRLLGIVNAMIRDNLRWEDTAASQGLGTRPARSCP